jgi:heme-degrading monooxygenase HmoA
MEQEQRMYVVHNRIEVEPDGAESFEASFAVSMRATLGGVPGLRRSLLMRPAGPNQPYVSTMEFDSKDDFRAWMKSDSFRAAHADTQAPGMQAPSAIEMFEVVEDVIA